MADHSFGNTALAILPQSGVGVINTTINGLTSSVNTAQGLIVGVGDEGEGNSGIEMPEHSRVVKELARIGNSPVAGSFLREVVESLKMTFPLAGARNTASNPTVDGDFDLATHFAGFDAVLKACGLSGAAWGGGAGHEYTPSGGATYASIAFWFGGVLVKYLDALAKVTLKLTPSEQGLVVVEFEVGSVAAWGAQSLSTITPGNQATAAPIVQGVAHSWGASRPYEEMEITIEPAFEERKDSNASTGLRKAQSAIDIGLKTTVLAATADPDFERDQLILTSAPTADSTQQIGTTTVNAGVANAVAIGVNNIEVSKIKPRKLGSYLGFDVEAAGKAISSAGSEFYLRFL